MSTVNQITRLHTVIYTNIHTLDQTLDYDRILEGLIVLANAVDAFEGETEEIWYIGEGYECLDDIITGAYWHLTEWHGGQASKSYAAMCALGSIYSPNMECADEDNATYNQLNSIAEDANNVHC